MILTTIVPNNYFMPFDAVKCWLKVIGKYDFTHCVGPDLDFNRNKIYELAKSRNEDFMMIDSDIVFTLEDITKVENYLKEGYDAVTGVYPIGMPPYPPCVFKRVLGDYELTGVKEGLNEIGACGGGFIGVSKRVFEKLPNHPFDNIREGEIFHGEDISFCHRLHENGFKLWCDSSIKVAQIRITKQF